MREVRANAFLCNEVTVSGNSGSWEGIFFGFVPSGSVDNKWLLLFLWLSVGCPPTSHLI